MGSYGPKFGGKALAVERRRVIRELFAKGVRAPQIARQLGMSLTRVNQIRRQIEAEEGHDEHAEVPPSNESGRNSTNPCGDLMPRANP